MKQTKNLVFYIFLRGITLVTYAGQKLMYLQPDLLINNNDVILQSEGEGVKKGQKLRLYLMYGPFILLYHLVVLKVVEYLVACWYSYHLCKFCPDAVFLLFLKFYLRF